MQSATSWGTLVATLLSSLGLYSAPAATAKVVLATAQAAPPVNHYLTPEKAKYSDEDNVSSASTRSSSTISSTLSSPSRDYYENTEDFSQLLCKLETKFAQRRLRLSSSGGKAKRLRVSLPLPVPFRNV
ncbi:hypothetical protein BASA81_000922 [Batrachochytrium salamandrivorans]|nr:hypothetical protein BASA81_000922 [Batrachochytrium salamandrivorans]